MKLQFNFKIQDFYWHNSTRAQFYQKEQNNTKHTCIKTFTKPYFSSEHIWSMIVSIWISHNSRKQYTRYRICNMSCNIRALSLMIYVEHMYIHMHIHTHVEIYLHMYYSAKRSRLTYILSMYLQQYRMVSGGQRKSNIYDSFRDSLFSKQYGE